MKTFALFSMLTGGVSGLLATTTGDAFSWQPLFASLFSSAGVCGLLLGYHHLQIVPELRRMREMMERQQIIDVLKMTTDPHVAPELKTKAAEVLASIPQPDSKR